MYKGFYTYSYIRRRTLNLLSFFRFITFEFQSKTKTSKYSLFSIMFSQKIFIVISRYQPYRNASLPALVVGNRMLLCLFHIFRFRADEKWYCITLQTHNFSCLIKEKKIIFLWFRRRKKVTNHTGLREIEKRMYIQCIIKHTHTRSVFIRTYHYNAKVITSWCYFLFVINEKLLFEISTKH